LRTTHIIQAKWLNTLSTRGTPGQSPRAIKKFLRSCRIATHSLQIQSAARPTERPTNRLPGWAACNLRLSPRQLTPRLSRSPVFTVGHTLEIPKVCRGGTCGRERHADLCPGPQQIYSTLARFHSIVFAPVSAADLIAIA
jgi:hypothetical protein